MLLALMKDARGGLHSLAEAATWRLPKLIEHSPRRSNLGSSLDRARQHLPTYRRAKFMKIAITNLKSINRLDFEIPSTPGVYILSATNGVGKTSLLNAISFVFDGSALKKSFQPGKNGFDSFKSTQIKYTDDSGSELTYKFTNSNWHPTKKNVRHTIPSYCTNGIFIKIDQHRVTPKDDELKNTTKTPCLFASDVATILGNDDFNDLATVTIKGRRKGFVCGSRTERYFSSGELAVIQIVHKLHNATSGSLVLIDEAEISLHPSTQQGLVEHITNLAKTKNLIVIISTHSQTLIKTSKSSNLYFLEKGDAAVSVINPCYPSYALQSISPIEDYFSDRVFLFEDSEAILFFNELKSRKSRCIEKYMSHICVPIGGWPQLAAFLDSAQIHFKKAASQEFKAIFDNDVQQKDLKSLPCHSRILGSYFNLPLIPEVTPIQWLMSDANALPDINTALRQRISRTILQSLKSSLIGKKSSDIKAVWRNFLGEYEKLTGIKQETIKQEIYGQWIDKNLNDVDAKSFFGKLF